jgi:hypothetical protein
MERSILIHFDSATGEVRVEAEGFEGNGTKKSSKVCGIRVTAFNARERSN